MQKLAHKEKKVHIVCATPIWPEKHMNELPVWRTVLGSGLLRLWVNLIYNTEDWRHPNNWRQTVLEMTWRCSKLGGSKLLYSCNPWNLHCHHLDSRKKRFLDFGMSLQKILNFQSHQNSHFHFHQMHLNNSFHGLNYLKRQCAKG
jgi:hypothetical protein